jgi:hemoglobin
MSPNEQDNRVATTPYLEAGELPGITRLVDAFYVNMETLPEAETIRNMHPQDLTESRKKQT